MKRAKFILGANKSTFTRYVRELELEKHLVVGKRFYGQYYIVEIIESEYRPKINIEEIEEIELVDLLTKHNLKLIK